MVTFFWTASQEELAQIAAQLGRFAVGPFLANSPMGFIGRGFCNQLIEIHVQKNAIGCIIITFCAHKSFRHTARIALRSSSWVISAHDAEQYLSYHPRRLRTHTLIHPGSA